MTAPAGSALDGLRRLAGGAEPEQVLALMAALVGAALAADSDLVLPSLVSRGEDGRVVLVPADTARLGAGDEGVLAPEVAHSGATPATLVFTVAAIGVWVAVGAWSPPPRPEARSRPGRPDPDQSSASRPADPSADPSPPAAPTPEEHRAWLDRVVARLDLQWGGQNRAAVELIGRCLQADPLARPHPRHLAEELRRLGADVPRPARRASVGAITGSRTPPRAGPRAVEGWLRRVAAGLLVASGVLVVAASCGLGALMLDGSGPASAAVDGPEAGPGADGRGGEARGAGRGDPEGEGEGEGGGERRAEGARGGGEDDDGGQVPGAGGDGGAVTAGAEAAGTGAGAAEDGDSRFGGGPGSGAGGGVPGAGAADRAGSATAGSAVGPGPAPGPTGPGRSPDGSTAKHEVGAATSAATLSGAGPAGGEQVENDLIDPWE